MEDIKLIDVADNLLVLDKRTVEKLFTLKNTDCLALYLFYYKTAKWQKTNTVKANDTYVRQCLGWGKSKLSKAKAILKENELIKIIQRKSGNKINGWYVEVAYIVSAEKVNNPENELVQIRSSSKQETNALKEYNKCLKNNNIHTYSFNNERASASSPLTELQELSEEGLAEDFEKIWIQYPRKVGKQEAFEHYKEWLNGKKYTGKTVKLTNRQMWYAVVSYAKEIEDKQTEERFIKMGSTFFNEAITDYVSFDIED